MAIADSVFEVASDFGAVIVSVTAVAGHLRFEVLSDVLVAELEVGDDFAVQESLLELPREHAIHVLQRARAMQLAVFEFAAIVEARLRCPLVVAFAAELAIFELTFVQIAVVNLKRSLPVEHICEEMAFVNILFAILQRPGHLALALHLRIDKVADVVAAIRPLELSVSLDLRILQISSVGKVLFNFDLFVRIVFRLLNANVLPLFVSFAVNQVAAIEVARYFYRSIVGFLRSISFHFVLSPCSNVLRVIRGLLVLALAVKHAI